MKMARVAGVGRGWRGSGEGGDEEARVERRQARVVMKQERVVMK